MSANLVITAISAISTESAIWEVLARPAGNLGKIDYLMNLYNLSISGRQPCNFNNPSKLGSLGNPGKGRNLANLGKIGNLMSLCISDNLGNLRNPGRQYNNLGI